MLPRGFVFSQSSLQDYVDCSRRFQLRYVQGQAWPGILAEPVLQYEEHMERGVRFHQLVERHQLGMDAQHLGELIDDPALLVWWRAYLGFDMLHGLVGRRYPEFTLSAELAGVRVSAMYDLLVVVPGERVVIFDWKTSLKKLPRQWFEARLQTRVYQYVLVAAGLSLFGEALRPEQVSMVYWVAGAPLEPVMFTYDRRQYALDGAYLESMVAGIVGRSSEDVWDLTADEMRCRFCEYRSLCGRGLAVGQLDEYGVDSANIAGEGVAFLLDDVQEVGF
ncbi:MAG: PD-(D/E)XK nuclease family protein [Chloroflexi bacterium]|nr:PD-(D/E)XK nuclease family protein [Chloroflexota bacterium]